MLFAVPLTAHAAEDELTINKEAKVKTGDIVTFRLNLADLKEQIIGFDMSLVYDTEYLELVEDGVDLPKFDGYFYNYSVPDAVWQDYVDSHRSWDETSPVSNETQNGKGKLFAFKVEYGYDYFVLDCLRLSMGISLGTTFGGYKAMGRDRNSLSVSDYADNRLLNAYWFGVKLGVGFLTF